MTDRTRNAINCVNLLDARRQILPVQQAPSDRVARRQPLIRQIKISFLIIPSLLIDVVVGVDQQCQRIHPVADRGVSGPWDPQFCGALCNGETQRLPAGALEALGGVRGRAPEANAFWQQHIENWLKIRYLGHRLHP